MKTVQTREEIVANFGILTQFVIDRKRVDPELKQWVDDLLRGGRNYASILWESGHIFFAPSRFVGYANNNLLRHLENELKDGRITSPAVSEIMGVKPAEDPDMEQLFLEFCNSLGIVPHQKKRRYWPPILIEEDVADPPVEDPDVAKKVLAAAEGAAQGFSNSPERRKAVEQQAMLEATAYLKSLQYEVEDTSSTRPYDLVGRKDGKAIYVEVKGTTLAGEEVFLTKNEVDHARAHPGEGMLFILHSIVVTDGTSGPVAKGGVRKVIWPWVPQDEDLAALAFKYRVPESPESPPPGTKRRTRIV